MSLYQSPVMAHSTARIGVGGTPWPGLCCAEKPRGKARRAIFQLGGGIGRLPPRGMGQGQFFVCRGGAMYQVVGGGDDAGAQGGGGKGLELIPGVSIPLATRGH